MTGTLLCLLRSVSWNLHRIVYSVRETVGKMMRKTTLNQAFQHLDCQPRIPLPLGYGDKSSGQAQDGASYNCELLQAGGKKG
jgi:hypothetical protein